MISYGKCKGGLNKKTEIWQWMVKNSSRLENYWNQKNHYDKVILYEWYSKKQFLSFWTQRATLLNKHALKVLHPLPNTEHDTQWYLVFKKIGKCYGGNDIDLGNLVYFDGW